MNAREHLFSLYEQWRRLSVAEGAGIQRADWAEVARCQNAKYTLQERIVTASEAVKREVTAGGGDLRELEAAIRGEVARLMELENQNALHLAEQQARAQREQSATQQATQKLRHVARAYGPPHATGWHSYS